MLEALPEGVSTPELNIALPEGADGHALIADLAQAARFDGLQKGVLPYDEAAINALSSGGEDYAFSFMIDKIKRIEITPAQLALEHCTGGAVVTDTNTGEIKALVSYPGYDSNKLVNNIDNTYFLKLLTDQSQPLYNNATQAKKAPGSTFKPIVAIAGIEENVISPYETVDYTGNYDTITPPIKCWIYPGHHGKLNVVGAIQNSCNFYFVDIGHRLSLQKNGEYSAELGLSRLRKYASLFGLDHKSGVELVETDPEISNENPEPSAIGQGTHSFANVQLARYVAAIASRGNVFELSVIERIPLAAPRRARQPARAVSRKTRHARPGAGSAPDRPHGPAVWRAAAGGEPADGLAPALAPAAAGRAHRRARSQNRRLRAAADRPDRAKPGPDGAHGHPLHAPGAGPRHAHRHAASGAGGAGRSRRRARRAGRARFARHVQPRARRSGGRRQAAAGLKTGPPERRLKNRLPLILTDRRSVV